MAVPPFQRFLDDNREAVYRFLLAAAGPDEVDDCFQETFAAALRAYPRLRGGSNLRAWVLTIAHRKALDAHRARARRAIPVERPEPVGAGEGEDGSASLGGRADLWSAVAALPPRHRQAVVLRFAGDLAYADVGRAMRCTEEAARRNVFEGLGRLREVVER